MPEKYRLPISLFLAAFLLCAGSGKAEDSDYLIMGHNTGRKVFISASSIRGAGNRAIRAMDSDTSTCWISANDGGPQWVSVDFGAKRLITSIVVYPGKKDSYRTIRYFKLQFLDGDWFDFATVQAAKKIAGSWSFDDRVAIDLTGVDASTFRIYIPADAQVGGVASIAEIEIYTGSSRVEFFDSRLKGLCLPVKNAYLPGDDSRLPNAPRAYRGGRHAGIDIYQYHTDDSYAAVPVTAGTPILAAADGVVLRADHDYAPTDIAEWNRRSAYFMSHPSTFMKRSFGGREVWIDHRNGVVTTYNHLSRIERSLKKGSRVSRGERIGWAGNSGLSGEAEGKNYGIHLHFEIWIDGNYLGYGMAGADIRKYLNWIFFLSF